MIAILQTAFPQLDPTLLHALQAELQPVSLKQGDTLFEKGESADGLYILQNGTLTVTGDSLDETAVTLAKLTEPGTIIGEMALISGLPRNATITADTPATLQRITNAAFQTLQQQYPQLIAPFKKWFVDRLQANQIKTHIHHILGDIDPTHFQNIHEQVDVVHLPTGTALFNQGDIGNELYLVANGRLRLVYTDDDNIEHFISEVTVGQTIGETSLFAPEPRQATAYAIRDTLLVKLTPNVLAQLVQQQPQLLLQLIQRTIAETRRNRPNTTMPEPSRGFVLIPANSTTILHEMTPHLVETIAHFGNTLHLNSQRFDQLYGKEGAAQTPLDDITNLAITDWLNRQELQYQYIIYEADPEWNTWTQRCLQNADRILIIADANTKPKDHIYRDQLYEQSNNRGRTELLLFHPNNRTHPQGTANWLAAWPTHLHYHVRRNDPSDWQRMGRRLVGKAVGVVFSGGGARSLNQIGALRALREMGIPIDVLGGASMGSLIGAAYALGKSLSEVYDIGASIDSKNKLLDFTFPMASILASKKVTKLLQNTAGDAHIEDTWRPFFCLSTNISKSIPKIHQTGLLWRGLRASLALPSIFLPMTEDGDLLVDGGVMNNLPIDVMKEQSDVGFVIALHNDTNMGEKEKYNFEPAISGWKVLRQRLNPYETPPKLPNLLDHHMQCMSVNFIYHNRKMLDLADLLIVAPVLQYGTFDFPLVEEISQVGYDATKAQIEQWLAAGNQFPPEWQL